MEREKVKEIKKALEERIQHKPINCNHSEYVEACGMYCRHRREYMGTKNGQTCKNCSDFIATDEVKEYADILTLIGELETENEKLMKLQARGGCRVAELGIENQQLKDRIAELEDEIERLETVIDIANERSYRKKFIEEWRKEYQKELDKEGKGHIAGFPDFDLVYKLYFEQKDRIAELEKENQSLKESIEYGNEVCKQCQADKDMSKKKWKLKQLVYNSKHDGIGETEMKSVIISIQPKDCELIVDEKMIIKVLKNRPKIETPFKCYIYCTYGQGLIEANDEILPNHLLEQKVSRYKTWGNCCNGKVIGEFVCDKVFDLPFTPAFQDYDFTEIYRDNGYKDFSLKSTCLTQNEIYDYGKGKPLYGWHISDLKIYDKPKELSEFKRWNRTEENSPCAHTKWLYPDCKDCKECNLIKSPKSWCYVEEI